MSMTAKEIALNDKAIKLQSELKAAKANELWMRRQAREDAYIMAELEARQVIVNVIGTNRTPGWIDHALLRLRQHRKHLRAMKARHERLHERELARYAKEVETL